MFCLRKSSKNICILYNILCNKNLSLQYKYSHLNTLFQLPTVFLKDYIHLIVHLLTSFAIVTHFINKCFFVCNLIFVSITLCKKRLLHILYNLHTFLKISSNITKKLMTRTIDSYKKVHGWDFNKNNLLKNQITHL